MRLSSGLKILDANNMEIGRAGKKLKTTLFSAFSILDLHRYQRKTYFVGQYSDKRHASYRVKKMTEHPWHSKKTKRSILLPIYYNTDSYCTF